MVVWRLDCKHRATDGQDMTVCTAEAQLLAEVLFIERCMDARTEEDTLIDT